MAISPATQEAIRHFGRSIGLPQSDVADVIRTAEDWDEALVLIANAAEQLDTEGARKLRGAQYGVLAAVEETLLELREKYTPPLPKPVTLKDAVAELKAIRRLLEQRNPTDGGS